MKRYQGIAASPGIAIGPAYVVDRRHLAAPQVHLQPEAVSAEIERLRTAVRESDRQYERIKARLEAQTGDKHGGILEAHQLMLHDERLLGVAEQLIETDRINAEWALRRATDGVKAVFDQIDDSYFRERRNDVDFVAERVLRNLLGRTEQVSLPPGSVLVAHDVSPADAVLFWRIGAVGIALAGGSAASHTSIIVRSLQIPAVMGLEHLAQEVGNGDLVLVDGSQGQLIVNPTPDLISEFETRGKREVAAEKALLADRHLPAQTLDGQRVALCANIELPEEIPSALDHGAEGIGLFRTEFLYMNRTSLPTEQEHYEQAVAALKQLKGRSATFRTFDLGADKVAPIAHLANEPNPALGLRSIRLSLREHEMFRRQLRGLLRASMMGPMRILFPMVSGSDELRVVRSRLEEARQSLVEEGVRVGRVEVGVMVETPSAAVVADLLLKDCDFLSIGTNDLIQYGLAVDRTSEHVTHLYDPFHPAILRMIRHAVDCALAAKKRVNVCGETAGDPTLAMLLVGMGVRELSMTAAAIPRVKRLLRACHTTDVRNMADQVLRADSSEEVQRILRSRSGV